MRWIHLVSLIALACTGCAHSVAVQAWHPADADVSGMKTIVVSDFSGDHGEAVSSLLAGRLWENEFYTVVDRAELDGGILPASFVKRGSAAEQKILASAKRHGVQGVVLGEVVEYRCEDQILRRSRWRPRFLDHADISPENERPTRIPGMRRREEEILLREGTVSVSFRLVDVETGEIRASKRISSHFEGSSADGNGKLPTQGEVLDDLSRQCLDEIVSTLAPHEQLCPIQLATCDFWCPGRRTVKEGVECAQHGDWKRAESLWHEALETNPENAAAYFNLAVVAANRQQYHGAEELAMQALRLQHTECFAKGLDLIREHREAYDKSEQQREARIVSIDTGIWR